MSELPSGWERGCLQEALDSADLQYVDRSEDEPELAFHYGPSLEDYLHITVSMERGGMRFAARADRPGRRPTEAWLSYANEVSLEWGVGRLYWNSRLGEPEMASTLFACPDHVPTADEIQQVCRELWRARAVLSSAAPPIPRFQDAQDPTGAAWVASRFQAAGFPFERLFDGSFSRCLDTGDEGACVVRLDMERPGVVFIDAVPLGCPRWLDHPAFLWAVHALNARLRSVAVTRCDDQLVVRRALPTAWIPMHPEWAQLTLEQLGRACAEVVQAKRWLVRVTEALDARP